MKFSFHSMFSLLALAAFGGGGALAGDYSTALGNETSGAIDAGIPGFVGPDGEGKARVIAGYDDDLNPIYANANNFVNPIFVGWATGVVAYSASAAVSAPFSDPNKALGPVTGDNFDIVSLGDLTATDIDDGKPAGFITLSFDYALWNGAGADFVVFENGFISAGGAGITGQIFAELAYVEVSSNGIDFARFPSLSLTGNQVGAYGTVDPTDVYNLAGKHVNAYGDSWGTPFDFDSLLEDSANVALIDAGLLDLDNIQFIRIVDIPGSGDFLDSEGNPIYDAWPTWGSGGFDLDAIGAIYNDLNRPIPEPAQAALLAGCAIGLIGAARRRRGRD